MSNKFIIVGDIHSNFIKFFEPLKQANIIKDYIIYPDKIEYTFVDSDNVLENENDILDIKTNSNSITKSESELKTNLKSESELKTNLKTESELKTTSNTNTTIKPTATVIYLGDFIHRGNENQIFILDALVDICNKYPDNVKFVLGNHEIAECNYYLNRSNNDLFQSSTLYEHEICKKCPEYSRIMRKFIDFLKTRNNLLKIEYPNFIISHTFHFNLFPGKLQDCLSNSMRYGKSPRSLRPKLLRYSLPVYFTYKSKYDPLSK